MDLSLKVPFQNQLRPSHSMKPWITPGHHSKTDFHLTGPSITMSSYSLQNVTSTKASIYGLPQLSRTTPTVTRVCPGIQLKSSMTPLTLFRQVILHGRLTSSHTMALNLMVLYLNGWSRSMSSIHVMYWLWLSSNSQHLSSTAVLTTLPTKNLDLMGSACGQILCQATGHGRKQ